MKVGFLVTILCLLSCQAWANQNKHNPSPFDVVVLNSPVKESEARFLLKIPAGFSIDKISYLILGPRIFKAKGSFKEVNLINTPQGPELRILVTKWKPGQYRLFVKVKDKKKKEHEFKRSYRDYAPFAIASKPGSVKEPDPKVNNATLLGVDTDDDGVRDDIQIWISDTFKDKPDLLQAFSIYAATFQETFRNKDNKLESNISSHASIKALNCILEMMGNKNIPAKDSFELTTQIRLLHINTRLRIEAYEKVNSNYHGESNKVLTQEESCEF